MLTQMGYRDSVLTIDTERHEVIVQGEVVNLTATEFDLLELLTEREGVLCRHGAILSAIRPGEIPYNHVLIKWHIVGLRRKIGPGLITTIRNGGYRYDAPKEC